MGKSLVIVESPEKARTIRSLLGQDFIVKATIEGIDLLSGIMSVDIKNGFKPLLFATNQKEKIQRALLAPDLEFDNAYFITDPDPSGETTAFYLGEALELESRKLKRIRCNQYTWPALKVTMQHPVSINPYWVEAQLARQAMDYLFKIRFHPIINKIFPGYEVPTLLQSVALRLLYERESEIETLTAQEFWCLQAELRDNKNKPFWIRLEKMENNPANLPSQSQANAVRDVLKSQQFVIKSFISSQYTRTPAPPFTTATLVQEASRKLGFSVCTTIEIARQLYEGLFLGRAGFSGLITFIFTDSTQASKDAIHATREFILLNYGTDYLPQKARFFKDKNRNHDVMETIRPTDVKRLPKYVKKYLNERQFQLYDLIWRRFIASQMAEAQLEERTATLTAGAQDRFLFTAHDSEIKFRGFLQVYDDNIPVNSSSEQVAAGKIPDSLTVDEKCSLSDLKVIHTTTSTPARYSDADLACYLITKGIARPVEIDSLFKALIRQGYIHADNFKINRELVDNLNNFLLQNFPTLFNVKFLERMEDRLDHIESGNNHYLDVVSAFYQALDQLLNSTVSSAGMKKIGKLQNRLNLCPQCGQPLKTDTYKKDGWVICSGFPDCSYQVKIDAAESEQEQNCHVCGARMVIKNGRYGRFWSCSNFPACKATRPFTVGLKCPMKDCDGQIIERKTGKGALFYGCSNYPTCQFGSWHKLIDQACSRCGSLYLEERYTAENVRYFRCTKCKKTFGANLILVEEDGKS